MYRATPTVPMRRGLSIRKLLVALVLVLALPVLGFSLWPKFSWSKPDAGPMMHLVEKYLMPENYFNGVDSADNQTMYQGWDPDTVRFASPLFPPAQDTPGRGDYYNFGSAHANGFQMAFCDGSVQMINYSINPEVHSYLSSRNDGLAIDGKKF